MMYKNDFKIVIDPGHGGINDSGAKWGYTEEADINLVVGLFLRYELWRHGFSDVIMTRDKDISVCLVRRREITDSHAADIFISIHCDSFHLETVHGQACWIQETAPAGSFLLSHFINQEFKKQFPERRQRGIKHADFEVLKQNRTAVLVECEFLSNPDSCEFLEKAENQIRIAQVLRKGIEVYYDKL